MNIRIADQAGDGKFYVHTWCKTWKRALDWIDKNNSIRIHVNQPYRRGFSEGLITIYRGVK